MSCRKWGNCEAGGSDGKGKAVTWGELVAQDAMGNERKEKSIIIKTVIEPPAIPDFNFDDTKTIYKNIPETENIINQ